MTRSVCLLVLLTASSAHCADLPPGAVVRLGDNRFRAGSDLRDLAISRDGKLFATVRRSELGITLVTIWNAKTGQPVREQQVNQFMYGGIAWGPDGLFAVARRAEAATKDKLAKYYPGDFCVWNVTDSNAKPPPVVDVLPVVGGTSILADIADESAIYTDFLFSANGKRVAARWKSKDDKHAIHVFDLKPADTTAKLTRAGMIDLGAEGADHVSISADGKTIITFRNFANNQECSATTWDIERGKPAKPVRVPYANRLMVTPDAHSLVVYAQDEAEWGFDLIDLATGKNRTLTRRRFSTEQIDAGRALDDYGGYAFTPNGRELVVAIDGKTLIIDVVAGKELGKLEGHAEAPYCIVVSADSSTIATADGYGLIRLWDWNTLRALHDAPGHRAPISHAELSPDGKRMLTWANDKTVRLWDLATGKELRAFTDAAGVTRERLVSPDRPTFTPDGTTILYSTKKQLIARDLQTGLEVPLPEDMAKLSPRFAAFSPDGQSVLTWIVEVGRVTYEVWDWPGGKLRFKVEDKEIREEAYPGFSPDGSAVYADACSPERWDTKTGKPLLLAWKDDRTNRVNPLASLRPNPRWLFHQPNDRSPEIIEAGTGKLLPHFRIRYDANSNESSLNPHWGCAISPNGRQYAWAWGFEPSELQLCESATCAIRRELTGHRGASRVLGFTPDGTRLLTTGDDHTILVWEMRLQHVPLPEAIKKQTDAVKLWNMLVTGKAKDAYLAMARLARDPDAAIKMAKMKLKPAAKTDRDTDATILADSRAIELLESLDSDDSRTLLKELASGRADAFRTQEAKRAIERSKR